MYKPSRFCGHIKSMISFTLVIFYVILKGYTSFTVITKYWLYFPECTFPIFKGIDPENSYVFRGRCLVSFLKKKQKTNLVRWDFPESKTKLLFFWEMLFSLAPKSMLQVVPKLIFLESSPILSSPSSKTGGVPGTLEYMIPALSSEASLSTWTSFQLSPCPQNAFLPTSLSPDLCPPGQTFYVSQFLLSL